MKKLLIKFSLVIKLKDLHTANWIVDNLNGVEYNGRPLKIYHMFGNLNCSSSVFYETLDHDTNRVVMNRIN